MTVRELITELQRRVKLKREMADAPVCIARRSEAMELELPDVTETEQVCDAAEGQQLDGLFLEITTWS